jgi:hypothetical protein
MSEPGGEIEPYLVYRLVDGQMECALWALADGQQALALFLSEQTAGGYQQAAALDSAWRVFCPARNDLVEILRQCQASGIRLAVLDPDHEKARRIFDLTEVLLAADET